MSNLPTGCSESTFGAPWNNVEHERKVEVTITKWVTVTISDSSDVDEAIIENVICDFSKIDYDKIDIQIIK